MQQLIKNCWVLSFCFILSSSSSAAEPLRHSGHRSQSPSLRRLSEIEADRTSASIPSTEPRTGKVEKPIVVGTSVVHNRDVKRGNTPSAATVSSNFQRTSIAARISGLPSLTTQPTGSAKFTNSAKTFPDVRPLPPIVGKPTLQPGAFQSTLERLAPRLDSTLMLPKQSVSTDLVRLADIGETEEGLEVSPSDTNVDTKAESEALDALFEGGNPLDASPIEEELPELLDLDTDNERQEGDKRSLVDDDDEEEKDDEKDDDEEDNIVYPSDLQSPPAMTSLSIWEARRSALENNKDIRVIAFEPSEAAQEVDVESAEFDTVFNLDVNAGKLDQQVATALQAQGTNLSALRTDFLEAENTDIGGLYLQKKLHSGGTVQWGYDADYNYFTPAGNFVSVNPAWIARNTLKIEQPLFKGRGAAIALAPIETAQAEQQVSMGEFNTLIHETMLELEVAYWEAALAGRSFQLLQEGARLAFETLHREEELLEAGRGSKPDTLQAEGQYRTIRSEMAGSKADWGTASRELYRLLGTAPGMQQGLIWATETPPIESILVDPAVAQDAVRNHPMYQGQLAAVRAAEIEVRTAANALQPDLAVRFAYAFSGLAEGLDDAIDIMVDRRYEDWTAGVVFRHPFGRRAELANVRKSHLALSREYSALDQIEHDLLYAFQEGYELARAKIEQYREQTERRSKSEALVEAQRELYEAGRAEIDLMLRAERALLDARIAETKALSEAWTAASEFRYALGMLNQ